MAMPADARRDAKQDEAVAQTFPASDPLASVTSSGARAVPPEAMMTGPATSVAGAIPLQRRFPDAETAKLALEGLVRDGPVDRAATELRAAGAEVELLIAAPPANAERLKDLLAKA